MAAWRDRANDAPVLALLSLFVLQVLLGPIAAVTAANINRDFERLCGKSVALLPAWPLWSILRKLQPEFSRAGLLNT